MNVKVCRSMRNHTPRYRLVLLLAADLALLASAHVGAQEKPSRPTLRTTTRAVIVNAVVTDRQGKPVTDLTSRDFTIFDNGHPQTVGSFLPTAGEQVTPPSSVEGPSVYTNIQAGSYPQHNQWSGEWRELRVKVNRPDVNVLARGGYLALPDP